MKRLLFSLLALAALASCSGELGSLQIGKDSVKEVPAGKECGMSIAGYNDIKEGDVIEAFQIVEIKRTL